MIVFLFNTYLNIDMNKTKLGLVLIIFGNILYLCNSYFVGSNTPANDFLNGLLLGIAIAINILGIIIIIKNIK